MSRDTPIVGAEVPDQRQIRLTRAVRNLDEFLEFLARLDAVCGPVARPREPTTGEWFLL